MKSIKFLLPVLTTILFSTSSCNKIKVDEIDVQNGQIYVSFLIGSGGGQCYDSGNIPSNVSSSIAYITGYPTDETKIPVVDQHGHLLGNVICPPGTGSQIGVNIARIRNWFNNGGGKLPVRVDWYNRWTNKPWEGTITAY